MKPKLTNEILSARRALEKLKFYSLVSDLRWDENVRKWVLECELRITSAPAAIPQATTWFVLIPEAYPSGDIDIYPAKASGVNKTFHHQNLNIDGDKSVQWRKGKICVNTPFGSLGRHGYDSEPVGGDERLCWHIKRAYEWLEAANSGQLIKKSDPFELPAISFSEVLCIAFNESPEGLQDWMGSRSLSGYAAISRHKNSRLAFLTAIENITGQTVTDAFEYGRGILDGIVSTECAIWIRLKEIPVLPPWQIPLTFGDLEGILKAEGRDLINELLLLAPQIRDGKAHFLLLGFPIPTHFGNRPDRLHWFAMRLPVLTSSNTKGFRSKERAFLSRDRILLSDKNRSLKWIETENWNHDQLFSRIKDKGSLKNKKILLIGAGAVGSCVAQLCARNAAEELLIIDSQCLEAGNLCRHTLTLDNVGYHKAEQLSNQVNLSSTHIKSSYINKSLMDCNDKDLAQIKECDVVLDCTGEDSVLRWLANLEMPHSTLFSSISVSIRAKRLFYFSASSHIFPLVAFAEQIKSWLDDERKVLDKEGLPLPGIGCWHPIFPAGAEDIWIMTAIGAKLLMRDIENPPTKPSLVVFEQDSNKGIFNEIREIKKS